MARKRFTAEQIIMKLREAEVGLAAISHRWDLKRPPCLV